MQPQPDNKFTFEIVFTKEQEDALKRLLERTPHQTWQIHIPQSQGFEAVLRDAFPWRAGGARG